MVEQADYGAYMASVYPGTTWHFERLSGGLINTTLRATKRSGDAPYDSLVLKHARPYCQAAGPDFPFTVKRQEVEATVLKLWDEQGALHESRFKGGGWRSPRCIRHDQGTESELKISDGHQEASVLMLSDLGRVVNAVEFLKLLTTTSSGAGAADSQTVPADLGRIIGIALAVVHSPETAETVRALPEVAETLCRPLSSDFVRLAALEPMRERLRPLPDAERMFQRLADDYGDNSSTKYRYRQCLVMGDFTPGSVLLRPPGGGGGGGGGGDEDDNRTPAIIDWEFACLQGRGVNGDMAQFLASVHCELIAAEEDDDDEVAGGSALVGVLDRFASGLCSGYRERAALRYRRRADDANVQLMRSAFLLHGREMVNQAHDVFEAHPRRTEMVRVGGWYIEAAGDDADGFVALANWETLRDEDRMLIQSLFVAE